MYIIHTDTLLTTFSFLLLNRLSIIIFLFSDRVFSVTSIPMTADWYYYIDEDDRRDQGSIRNVFDVWTDDMSYNLDPRWSDYGSVDKVEVNNSIKELFI